MPNQYIKDSRTTKDRFDEKWIPEPTTGCWLWIGAFNQYGYGVIYMGTGRGHVPNRAHRISWEIHRGPIPYGLCVLHRCDNPSCVRPDHLFLGTQSENVRDAVVKGRNARGSRIAASKLNEEDVRGIKALFHVDEMAPSEIAKHYGISINQTSAILRGQYWKHV